MLMRWMLATLLASQLGQQLRPMQLIKQVVGEAPALMHQLSGITNPVTHLGSVGELIMGNTLMIATAVGKHMLIIGPKMKIRKSHFSAMTITLLSFSLLVSSFVFAKSSYADECDVLAEPYLAEGVTSDMIYGSDLRNSCLRNKLSLELAKLIPDQKDRREIETQLFRGLSDFSKAMQRIRTENKYCVPSCGSMESYVYKIYEAEIVRDVIKSLPKE